MTSKNNYTATVKTRYALLAGLIVSCMATPARTQEQKLGSVYDLDTYVVVANRQEMPIRQVGSSVEVLEGISLKRGQETFLLDRLRLIPGLYLRNTGGPGGAFGMTTRGLSSNMPTVLVNGIEVSNPSTGQIMNFGSLLSGNVDRVEVLKGPQSSLYGADALAGVISIDTLDANSAPGGRASVSYGSFDTFQYGLGHNGSTGALSWAVDANRYESEGISAQDPAFGPEWADDDAYDATNFSSKFAYALGDDASVSLSTYYVDTFAEFDPGLPSPWLEPFADNYGESEEFYAKLGGEARVSESWTSSSNIAYSNVNYFSYSGYGYEADGDRYKADWLNTVAVNDTWRFLGGVEHEIEDNRSDIGDRDNTSLFLENLFSMSERMDWTVGGRYDENSMYGSEFTYRATASYRLPEWDARLRGSFGTSFQAPTFFQQTSPFYGNPDLKPESGKGWDLGFEKAFADGRIFFSSALFGNDITDKIAWDGAYENLDTYESVGVETSLRLEVSEGVRLHGSHTYSDAEESGGLEALRVPRNQYTFGMSWQAIGDTLDLNLSGLIVSSQYSDNLGRSSRSKQPGYEVVNLAAEYRLTDQVVIWGRVANLLDEEYEEIVGYQTAGINGMVGARFAY